MIGAASREGSRPSAPESAPTAGCRAAKPRMGHASGGPWGFVRSVGHADGAAESMVGDPEGCGTVESQSMPLPSAMPCHRLPWRKAVRHPIFSHGTSTDHNRALPGTHSQPQQLDAPTDERGRDASFVSTPTCRMGLGSAMIRGALMAGWALAAWTGCAWAGEVASATAVLAGDAVTSVTVSHGGAGYDSEPAVTLRGGGGTGATAMSRLGGGRVLEIVVLSGGSGYTNAPLVSIVDPPVPLVLRLDPSLQIVVHGPAGLRAWSASERSVVHGRHGRTWCWGRCLQGCRASNPRANWGSTEQGSRPAPQVLSGWNRARSSWVARRRSRAMTLGKRCMK